MNLDPVAGRDFEFTDDDFAFVSDLVRKTAGIVLNDSKRNMVYGRMSRRLRELNMATFGEYREVITSSEGTQEWYDFLNALTTNVTRFFREPHHFDFLAKVALQQKIQRVAAGERKRLRIWSAGSSTGEEAYSIAMTVHDTIKDVASWDARILATDIDTKVLATGSKGVYRDDLVQNIKPEYQKRFLENAPGEQGKQRVKAPLRSMVAFKHLNLLQPWPVKGPFDMIFCRNVMIYFDKPTQKNIVERYADVLDKNGYLCIGHAENISHVAHRFKLIGQTIYSHAPGT